MNDLLAVTWSNTDNTNNNKGYDREKWLIKLTMRWRNIDKQLWGWGKSLTRRRNSGKHLWG
jgi:hypothetical protein